MIAKRASDAAGFARTFLRRFAGREGDDSSTAGAVGSFFASRLVFCDLLPVAGIVSEGVDSWGFRLCFAKGARKKWIWDGQIAGGFRVEP